MLQVWELGHISRFCNSKEVKDKFEYFSNLSPGKSEKRRHFDSRSGILELEDLIESFPNVFKNLDRPVEFCSIEKCSIITDEGKIIVKKGANAPQAKEKQAEKYLMSLIDRKILRRSNSQWRNPIRFIEKPDGNLRLVSNLMALNDIVKKD
ncbi:retrotransposon-like family member (retr-1), partial [Pseudoloma neurophilia]